MLSFLEFLEANYDYSNKRKLTHDQRMVIPYKLAQIHGQDTTYISFTSLQKLGLNPSSKWDTPIGIYAYPVKYALEHWDRGRFNVPYAGGQPHAYIFTARYPEKVITFTNRMSGNVTIPAPVQSNLDRFNELLSIRHVQNVQREFYQCVRQIHELILSTLNLEDVNSKVMASHMIDEFFRRAIHDETVEIDFDSVHDLILKLTYQYGSNSKKKFPYEEEVSELSGMTGRQWNQFKERVLFHDQRLSCPEAFVWNATRMLSKSPADWTRLLMKLGITGCRDDGSGTIHSNEPTQAVFFGSKYINLLQMIDNDVSSRYNSYGNLTWHTLRDGPDPSTTANEIIFRLRSAAMGNENTMMQHLYDAYKNIGYLKYKHKSKFDELRDTVREILANVKNVSKDSPEAMRLIGKIDGLF